MSGRNQSFASQRQAPAKLRDLTCAVSILISIIEKHIDVDDDEKILIDRAKNLAPEHTCITRYDGEDRSDPKSTPQGSS